jgi:hypothetical protein
VPHHRQLVNNNYRSRSQPIDVHALSRRLRLRRTDCIANAAAEADVHGGTCRYGNSNSAGGHSNANAADADIISNFISNSIGDSNTVAIQHIYN